MKSSRRLVLIGGGGHCKSVLDAALQMNWFTEIVITDHSLPAGTKIFGCTVVGNDNELPKLYDNGFRHAFIAVGSIHNTEARHRAYQKASVMGFDFPNIIDPSAVVSKYIRLGKGIFIGKNTVVNSDTKIEDVAIINTGAVIEHNSYIGAFSHIAVGAVICGSVRIEEDVFVGANATVIQGVNIGMKSIIGAGAVVKGTIPSCCIAVGIPAKVIKYHGQEK